MRLNPIHHKGRLFVGILVFVLAASALYGLWPTPLPDLPPEPSHIEIRGPGEVPQNAKYEEWLNATKARQASLAGASVAIDTDVLALVVGILTVMTLLLALLSKYLIAPLITRQLSDFMGKVDEKFVSRQTIEAHLVLDDARYEAIESQLDKIWERVK